MKNTLLMPFALGFSWMFCPEALTIAGNVTGQLGWLVLPVLALVAVVFTVCAKLLTHQCLPTSAGREYLLLQRVFGTIPAASLTFAACLPLIVLTGTALLVTAGYAFNEVFLYWFPNFGFAFLVLALLTILQLFREQVIIRAQVCFMTLAVGGILVLSLCGLLNPAEAVITPTVPTIGFSSISTGASVLLFFLFVGTTFQESTEDSRFFIFVPVIGVVILCCWITVSLTHVSLERLASSTIPYMTVAGKIAGDPGRRIMGIVVISGACGALNGLMLLGRRMVANLAEQAMVPGLLSVEKQRWLLPPLLGMITALLMATGLAGDELLEVLLWGALILWLLYHTLLCLSAIVWLKREVKIMSLAPLFCVLLLIGGLLTIVSLDPHRMQLILFIFSVLTAGSLLIGCWLFIKKLSAAKYAA